MKHVTILIPRGPSIISSLVGPFKVFNRVNGYLTENGQKPYYKIDFAGLTEEERYYNDIFTIRTTCSVYDIKKTDLIIVGAIAGDIKKAISENKELITWMRRQYENGAEIASLCMGAFLLAPTGLLDGKICSTHWIGSEHFSRMFPAVDLQPHKVVTEQDGIYTSGGAYSFLNLILHLIEKFNGPEIAVWISKVFEIDYDRDSQGHFSIFNGQKSHTDEPILNSQQFIEANYRNKLSIDQLADISILSKRNFIRRFKKATSHTPGEYIQRIRIEAAKRILERPQNTVSEAMYEVGYNDSKAFRETFRKFTGISPSDYKSKYTREPIGIMP